MPNDSHGVVAVHDPVAYIYRNDVCAAPSVGVNCFFAALAP